MSGPVKICFSCKECNKKNSRKVGRDHTDTPGITNLFFLHCFLFFWVFFLTESCLKTLKGNIKLISWPVHITCPALDSLGLDPLSILMLGQQLCGELHSTLVTENTK